MDYLINQIHVLLDETQHSSQNCTDDGDDDEQSKLQRNAWRYAAERWTAMEGGMPPKHAKQ